MECGVIKLMAYSVHVDTGASTHTDVLFHGGQGALGGLSLEGNRNRDGCVASAAHTH